MAAGVPKKGASMGKVCGQESEQSPRDEKPQGTDQVMIGEGGMEGENQGANHTQASTQTVHVVREIERVDEGQKPKDGDQVTDDCTGDEQRDASAGKGDEHGDKSLCEEFFSGRERVSIVNQPNHEHSQGAEDETTKLQASCAEAVGREINDLGVPKRKRELNGNNGRKDRDDQPRGDNQATGERDRIAMDFAMTGMVDEVPFQSLPNPKGRRESARCGSDHKNEQIDPGGKIVFHGRLMG